MNMLFNEPYCQSRVSMVFADGLMPILDDDVTRYQTPPGQIAIVFN